MEEAAGEQSTLGLYTPEQSAAALDPSRHEAEWLPNNKNYHRQTFAATSTTGLLVGCVSLYQREDDGVAVLEGLFVKKSDRRRRHARRLVRAALADAKVWGIKAIDALRSTADQAGHQRMAAPAEHGAKCAEPSHFSRLRMDL